MWELRRQRTHIDLLLYSAGPLSRKTERRYTVQIASISSFTLCLETKLLKSNAKESRGASEKWIAVKFWSHMKESFKDCKCISAKGTSAKKILSHRWQKFPASIYTLIAGGWQFFFRSAIRCIISILGESKKPILVAKKKNSPKSLVFDYLVFFVHFFTLKFVTLNFDTHTYNNYLHNRL